MKASLDNWRYSVCANWCNTKPKDLFSRCFASQTSKMSSNPQRIQQHLENRGGSSESLVFDPATGKLMVKPQQEAQNSDRTVMLDMNKAGSGGFFSFSEHSSKENDVGGFMRW